MSHMTPSASPPVACPAALSSTPSYNYITLGVEPTPSPAPQSSPDQPTPKPSSSLSRASSARLSSPNAAASPPPNHHMNSSTMSRPPAQHQDQPPNSPDASSVRRRRDVRAARDRLSGQFDQLRRVLPTPPDGAELIAKAQVLEHTVSVLRQLMTRATHLAVELAVASPEATRKWVNKACDDGRRPLPHAVASIMKLFAARTNWRYAEWWSLTECEAKSLDEVSRTRLLSTEEKPAGVLDDPGNVHGCVVRDTSSVMTLAWTLVRHNNIDGEDDDSNSDEARRLTQFARLSSKFEFRPRVGMPGRVWTSRRAEWLVDLEDSEAFIRSPLAKDFGMQTCLAVPVQFGGHVHSIMAFYSADRRGYDPEVYDLACTLATCLSEEYSPNNTGPWTVPSDDLFSR